MKYVIMKKLFILLLFLIPGLLFSQSVMDYNPSMWLIYNESVILVDGKVSAWGDNAGNGNDFIQTTAGYRPLWVDGVGIDFDGVDDMLPLKTGSEYNFGINATIFIRARMDSLKDFAFISGNGGGQYMILRYKLTTNIIYFMADGTSGFYVTFIADTASMNDGNFHVYTFTRIDSTDSNFFLDGVQKTRIILSETDGDIEFAVDGIAYRQNNSDFEFNGVISEIIWFESVLSTENRELIEYYLINGNFPKTGGPENRFPIFPEWPLSIEN